MASNYARQVSGVVLSPYLSLSSIYNTKIFLPAWRVGIMGKYLSNQLALMLGFNKKEKKKGLNHNQTDLLCLSLLAVSVTIARVSCFPFSHVICICDMTVRFRHVYCFYKKLGKVKSFIYLLDMTHSQRATTYIQITNYMI